MIQKKNLFILSALAALAISCTLTNATTGAAVPKMPTGTATASQHAQPMQSPTPRPTRCTVTAYALNVRNCGGVDCLVIGTLTEGDTLTILELGEWLQVQTDDGGTGYINGAYCTTGE